MIIRNVLILLLFSLSFTQLQAVHSTNQLQSELGGISTQEKGLSTFKKKVKKSFFSMEKKMAKWMKRASLLDNPKRILIYAGVALVSGIILTLVANVIALGFIGTLAWLCLIASFALVILWIYTILIRA